MWPWASLFSRWKSWMSKSKDWTLWLYTNRLRHDRMRRRQVKLVSTQRGVSSWLFVIWTSAKIQQFRIDCYFNSSMSCWSILVSLYHESSKSSGIFLLDCRWWWKKAPTADQGIGLSHRYGQVDNNEAVQWHDVDTSEPVRLQRTAVARGLKQNTAHHNKKLSSYYYYYGCLFFWLRPWTNCFTCPSIVSRLCTTEGPAAKCQEGNI